MDRENKSGAVWLGPGEFTSPDDHEARTQARKQFLEAIREEAPDVLGTLSGEPWMLFRGMWNLALETMPEEQHPLLSLFHLRRSSAFHWYRFKNADPEKDPDGAKLG